MRRVAIIGHGAIGRDLATALASRDGYALAVVLRPGSASAAAVDPACAVLPDVGALARFAPALVVEAAGAGAVREWGAAVLGLGVPLLLSSVGALHDDALRHALVATAQAAGTRLYLPSGALAGLDYVRAMRGAPNLRVRYESRKPTAAWADELARLGPDAAPDAALTLFQGNARAAAARYPANLNVAATLALAGAGFEETEVRVVADPAARGNTHAIRATSDLGELDLVVANRPSPDNPKTSGIVSRALLAAVEQHFSTVVML
ncbi:aspartate dehydrogenase [Methylobacterium terricola]|uniref:L-aspartate dehydrogenase n=1 Tax=Methylobacterium terricola TaxID=2583531 RepID=A0A5C4L922_9HYPH|nr:aspartate dehydrogenase [Methylobacterium terricola]TNC08331.1 aspartate dehydrogenase [Methylobacterium terricola]